MRQLECSKCGSPARAVRGNYTWQDVDLPVVLKNIELIQCGKCGNTDPVIPKLGPLMRLLAVAVISKPYRLSGGELRFLRKHLNMTGEAFAALLRIDRTTLSKWENNDDPIGEQSDRLIRVVVLELGDGLKEEMARLTQTTPADWIRSFPKISKTAKKVGLEVDIKKMVYKVA